MKDEFVLIEQAINKAVQKGAYNLAEVNSILQALGALQNHLFGSDKQQSNDSAAN